MKVAHIQSLIFGSHSPLHLNKTTLSSIPEFESICPHGRGSYNLGTASSPHYKRVSVIVFHFQI